MTSTREYAKCVQHKCDKKHDCCRYLMISKGARQTSFAPRWENCEYHWPAKDGATFAIALPDKTKTESNEL